MRSVSPMLGLGLHVGDADAFFAQLPIRKFTTTLEDSNEFRNDECGDTSTPSPSPTASAASVHRSPVVQIQYELSSPTGTAGETLLTAQEMIVGQTSSREEPSPLVPPRRASEPCVSKCDVPVLPRITPRPTSSEGVRRSPHDRAIMMAPMLRARHMDLLDMQYIRECSADTRSALGKRIGNAMPRRSSAGYRAQSARGRVALNNHAGDMACGSQSARGRSVSKGVVCEKENTPGSRNSGPGQACTGSKEAVEDTLQQRPLGPKAVMPLVKGQMKVQAEAARREADKVARDARLKDQFRVQPPSCQRSKTRGRSDRHMLQRFR